MPLQRLPLTAERYAADARAETAAAVAAVLRLWRRMDPADVTASWARVRPGVVAVVTAAQTRATTAAQDYVPQVLAETGQEHAVRPSATVTTTGLVGVAGDGRDVATLIDGAVVGTRQALADGVDGHRALADRSPWLSMVVGTVLADTRRASESLAIGVRPVTGYVRMLQPPSCSRCAILAGRYYRKNTGFQRHPRCDCLHIPASESVAGDMRVSPIDYFDSLSTSEQDAVFTSAGAQAIRHGADLNQVVNARRGMQTAQVGGRKVPVTTEGTTRRGWASRTTSGKRPRLMPETIAQVATGQADYLRLLRANGYIL